MADRTIKAPNPIYVNIAKSLGLGEKRESEWWFTAEEIVPIKAAYEERQANRKRDREERAAARKASKRARAVPDQAPRVQGEKTLAELWFAQHGGQRDRKVLKRRPATKKRAPADSFYTMPYIEDPQLFKAVKFALHMRKQGKSTNLAVYRAAKYYALPLSEVARELGRIGARKAIKNRIGRAYESGRSGEEDTD